MYILFTQPGCGKCQMAKYMLTSKGIKFKEVNALDEEGKELAQKYGIQSTGAIVDDVTGKEVEIGNIMNSVDCESCNIE